MDIKTNDTETLSPQECENMKQVRAGVDATDAALLALLARRFAYMDAAARIKTDRNAVRDEARKALVIGNAAIMAEELKIPSQSISDMWEILVETSIDYELERWDEKMR
jgi:isochorismate pyruvate lyase